MIKMQPIVPMLELDLKVDKIETSSAKFAQAKHPFHFVQSYNTLKLFLL